MHKSRNLPSEVRHCLRTDSVSTGEPSHRNVSS